MNPVYAGWRKLRDHYAEVFAPVPATRLLTPDAQVLADAGVVAGTLGLKATGRTSVRPA